MKQATNGFTKGMVEYHRCCSVSSSVKKSRW